MKGGEKEEEMIDGEMDLLTWGEKVSCFITTSVLYFCHGVKFPRQAYKATVCGTVQDLRR